MRIRWLIGGFALAIILCALHPAHAQVRLDPVRVRATAPGVLSLETTVYNDSHTRVNGYLRFTVTGSRLFKTPLVLTNPMPPIEPRGQRMASVEVRLFSPTGKDLQEGAGFRAGAMAEGPFSTCKAQVEFVPTAIPTPGSAAAPGVAPSPGLLVVARRRFWNDGPGGLIRVTVRVRNDGARPTAGYVEVYIAGSGGADGSTDVPELKPGEDVEVEVATRLNCPEKLDTEGGYLRVRTVRVVKEGGHVRSVTNADGSITDYYDRPQTEVIEGSFQPQVHVRTGRRSGARSR